MYMSLYGLGYSIEIAVSHLGGSSIVNPYY